MYCSGNYWWQFLHHGSDSQILSTWISVRPLTFLCKILIDKLLTYGIDEQWGRLRTDGKVTPRGWWSVLYNLLSQWLSQGSILGPIPLSIFINDLDDGAKCTPASFRMTQNWEVWLMCQRVVLPPTETSREMSWQEPHIVQQEMQIMSLHRNNTWHQCILYGKQPDRKGPGDPGDDLGEHESAAFSCNKSS